VFGRVDLSVEVVDPEFVEVAEDDVTRVIGNGTGPGDEFGEALAAVLVHESAQSTN
jgi:hypothetical protein